MLYLAFHFVWFLVAAFAIGLVFGWLTCRGGLRGLLSGPSLVALLLWAGAAALVWFRLLNDQPALWVETGLLHVAAYAAGCLVACLLKGSAVAGAEPALALPAPRLALPGPVPASAASPAGAATALADDPAPMPRLDGEDEIQGRRPAGFVAAHGGVADDLKLVKGIGKQNEGRLHGLGIWHFAQIAAWTPENVEWVGGYLAFPGRIEREDWVGQAKLLASGAETEFARRARAGLVESSQDDGSKGQGNLAAVTEAAVEGTAPVERAGKAGRVPKPA